jgi:hypothetical protein
MASPPVIGSDAPILTGSASTGAASSAPPASPSARSLHVNINASRFAKSCPHARASVKTRGAQPPFPQILSAAASPRNLTFLPSPRIMYL